MRFSRRFATLRQGPDDDVVLHAISHDQQPVAWRYPRTGFRPFTIDLHMPAAHRGRSLCARLEKARIPKPAVDPHGLCPGVAHLPVTQTKLS